MTNFEKLKRGLTYDKFVNMSKCDLIRDSFGWETCDGISCNECGFFLQQEGGQLHILDRAEKEYLSAVIKPWRGQVKCITKQLDANKQEYIIIVMKHGDDIYLPSFPGGTMYKGMELRRHYTLGRLEI